MLHRTNKEVDKEGNVIGGDLKKKCDEFIECLDKFQGEYLSDKFNFQAESGAYQEKSAQEFEKWVSGMTSQYNKEKLDREKRKKANDDYIKYLDRLVQPLKRYLDLSNKQDLDDDTIKKFKDVLSAEAKRQYDRVERRNKEIASENQRGQQKYAEDCAKYKKACEDYERKLAIYSTDKSRYDHEMIQYRIQLAEYNRQKGWIDSHNRREQARYDRENIEYASRLIQSASGQYPLPRPPRPAQKILPPSVPTEPIRPREPQAPIAPVPFIPKSFIPLPTGNWQVPESMDDTLLKSIEGIVSKNPVGTSGKTNDLNNQTFCTEFIFPLLDKAYRYVNAGIKNPVVIESEDSPSEWFLKRTKDYITTMYLKCGLCDYDGEGIPKKAKRIPDIYWTVWRLDLADAFSECMKDFKPAKKSSGSTKKWIEKVCKELKKPVNDHFVEKYMKKRLDALAKALSIKPPSTISKRPTIKQKPVQEKLKVMIEYVKKAAQNTSSKLSKIWSI